MVGRDDGIAVSEYSEMTRPAADGNGNRKTPAIPIPSIKPGESPRRNGEDEAHIARLSESDGPLPPILVNRRTMEIIDGRHRLAAASLKGQKEIEVEFFDGNPADAYLLAVQANVTHGLPLSISDRRAAAERIIASHPHMSDRAVGEISGLAARTVAGIRRRSDGTTPTPNKRLGKDGRLRPLNGAEGRKKAAKILEEDPEISLREVGRRAGISPATVRDVRQRLERGEAPVSGRRPASASDADTRKVPGGGPEGKFSDTEASVLGKYSVPDAADRDALLGKLLRDPSLKYTNYGRLMLRLLQLTETGAKEWPAAIEALPPHCATSIIRLAYAYIHMWQELINGLEDRVQTEAARDTRLRPDRTTQAPGVTSTINSRKSPRDPPSPGRALRA